MYRLTAVLIFLFAPACTGVAHQHDSNNSSTADGVDADKDAGGCLPLEGTVITLARGTYCVTGDVIIPSEVTLDIPAGTTFIVMGRYHFGRDPALPDYEPPLIRGSGSIRAIGTAAEPIIFRGESATTGWFGLTVSHAAAPVQLEYVTISDTYKDDHSQDSRVWRRGGALNSYLNKKGTVIRHCTFTNNRAYSVGGAVEIYGHGQWPDEAPVEITDSLFEGNSSECGVYRPSSSDLCGGGALRLTQVSGNGELVKLQGNVFRNNKARRTAQIDAFGGAIGGAQTSVTLGVGNVFEGNHADTGDGAVSCNHLPASGSIIKEIDPSATFISNLPDNGCGR